MAHILVEKRVLFVGAWRTTAVTDGLLRDISVTMEKRRGYPAKLQLSTEGLKLYVITVAGQVGKVDLIHIQHIYDITINKYKPYCLLCIIADPVKRLSVLVCRCDGDKDASHMMQAFRQYKRSVSGEGFNFDLKHHEGKNWTLKPHTGADVSRGHVVSLRNDGVNVVGESKSQTLQEHARAHKHSSSDDRAHRFSDSDNIAYTRAVEKVYVDIPVQRVQYRVGDKTLYNIGIQTDDESHGEIEEEISDGASPALKEELIHLSAEVRAIKTILSQTTRVSASEYFRISRELNGNLGNNTLEHVTHAHTIDATDAPIIDHMQQNGGNMQTIMKGYSTKIVPDHDIRSFATQTPGTKYVLATPEGHALYSRGVQRMHFNSRLPSDSHLRESAQSRVSEASRRTSSSDEYGDHHRKSVKLVPPANYDRLRHAPPIPFIMKTTLERPIEKVYRPHMLRKSVPKVIVTPRNIDRGHHLDSANGDKRRHYEH